jgi:hypothetical protein
MMAIKGKGPMLGLMAAAIVLLAQTVGPAADQPHAGDRNVTGTAPGATSLTVYDVSSGGKRYLGSGSSIDKKGFFAVAVNPPLTLQQKIVIVDAQGHASAAVAVIARTLPTAHPHLPR